MIKVLIPWLLFSITLVFATSEYVVNYRTGLLVDDLIDITNAAYEETDMVKEAMQQYAAQVNEQACVDWFKSIPGSLPNPPLAAF